MLTRQSEWIQGIWVFIWVWYLVANTSVHINLTSPGSLHAGLDTWIQCLLARVLF